MTDYIPDPDGGSTSGMPCIICERIDMADLKHADITFDVACRKCGRYSARSNIHGLVNDRNRHLVAAVTRYYTEIKNESITLDYYNFGAYMKEICSWDFKRKLENLLNYIGTKSGGPGKTVVLNTLMDYPLVVGQEEYELDYFIAELSRRGLTKNDFKNISGGAREYLVKLTDDGYAKFREIARNPDLN
ncbi:MAG: hypothetical protein JXJ19_02015 [Elusimicrobia bacterium]|nr:hypothetical protein [Elusimicrobiota bacterium]